MSKRSGDCAADQKPGDVIVNDSIKLNLFDMAGMGGPIDRAAGDSASAPPAAGD